jgi:hypothetical protein
MVEMLGGCQTFSGSIILENAWQLLDILWIGNYRKNEQSLSIFWIGNPRKHMAIAMRILDQKS